MTICAKDLTASDLHQCLATLGVSPRLARQLHGAIVRQGAIPTTLPGVSPRLLQQVQQAIRIPRLECLDKRVSAEDGFTKYLFRGAGPEPFEAVGIPLVHRPEDCKYVVCVSSQVGCAMGCTFCATGRMGLIRNLEPWEMVDQVIQVQADSPHPVRGVVFMGMGEPLANYDAVIQACRILSEPSGLAIGAKAITISTVGLVPAIRRYTAEGHHYRLVVSLTSADPDQRRELMPVERVHPTADLIRALREYHQTSGRRVMLAWIMLAGVNTRAEDARRLAELTAGLPIKLDLIDVNDPTGRFRAPTREELDAFRDALTAELGMPVARRYSGGRDIHAACGMLAGGGG